MLLSIVDSQELLTSGEYILCMDQDHRSTGVNAAAGTYLQLQVLTLLFKLSLL
jgi:hypothetical protein